ncbi:MAG: histidine phosphatase family protein [Thermodesulfobacteriota bacterium]
MNKAIYLVRHGKTRANKDNRFAGRTEEPLHLEGIEEITEVAEKALLIGPDLICSGPSCRTKQSAEIIAQICGLNYQVEPGLDDINLPHWEGLTKDEIRIRWGLEYSTWLETPAAFQPGRGETLFDVRSRAVSALQRVRERGSCILLVTHLIVARCLLLYQQGRPVNDFRSVKVRNGEIIRLC